MVEPWLLAVLTAVALVAGFIDSIAGGGGLLVMPALLWSGVPPLAALGTNKLQSVFGTAIALRNYARSGLVDWRNNLPTIILAFAGAVVGVVAVQAIRAEILALIIPLLLVTSALYVLVSPRMTDDDAHERLSRTGYAPVGTAIGFYDGFFGPGAGTFYTTSLVALRGAGLTRATALAKMFNLASASASLLMFAIAGDMLWQLGLCMAAGSMACG